MRSVHPTLAWLLIGTNAVAGLWCLAAYWLSALRTTLLWWVVGVAMTLPFVQAFTGAMWTNTGGALRDMHALYGFSAIVAVAVVYSYGKSDAVTGDTRYLLYGLGCLFIMGLGLRNLIL